DHLPDAIDRLSRENPIEMLLRGEVQPGAVAMWVGYGGKDQFNLDAQIESFLYVARTHGFDVTVWYDPRGRHNIGTARRMIPSMICWLAQQLEPFSQPALPPEDPSSPVLFTSPVSRSKPSLLWPY